MPNLYLSTNGSGYAKTFFVRRERKANKKGYLYWLGHRTEDETRSERVQVSQDFYNDFRIEIERLKERWKAHKKLAAANVRKARTINRTKPHCGVAPVCTADGTHCFCNCDKCR